LARVRAEFGAVGVRLDSRWLPKIFGLTLAKSRAAPPRIAKGYDRTRWVAWVYAPPLSRRPLEALLSFAHASRKLDQNHSVSA
jgi:hypothetical protein